MHQKPNCWLWEGQGRRRPAFKVTSTQKKSGRPSKPARIAGPKTSDALFLNEKRAVWILVGSIAHDRIVPTGIDRAAQP